MSEVLIDGVVYVPKQEPIAVNVTFVAAKKPEVGKWYTYTTEPWRGVGQCKEINGYNSVYLIYFPGWSGGHNNNDKYSGGHCWWCAATDLTEAPAPVPARGDPIFVWDDGTPDTMPAHMEYFHHKDKDGVCDMAWDRYGAPGCYWDHYRPFDAALVGVARRDWPQ